MAHWYIRPCNTHIETIHFKQAEHATILISYETDVLELTLNKPVKLPMRIAVGQIWELTDDIAAFTKQMGIRDMQFIFLMDRQI